MKKYSTLQRSSHKSSHEIIPSDNRASYWTWCNFIGENGIGLLNRDILIKRCKQRRRVCLWERGGEVLLSVAQTLDAVVIHYAAPGGLSCTLTTSSHLSSCWSNSSSTLVGGVCFLPPLVGAIASPLISRNARNLERCSRPGPKKNLPPILDLAFVVIRRWKNPVDYPF